MDIIKKNISKILQLSERDLKSEIKSYGNELITLYEQGFFFLSPEKGGIFFELLEPFTDKINQILKEKEELAHTSFENRIIGDYTISQMIKGNPDAEFLIDEIIKDYGRIAEKLKAAIENLKTYKCEHDTLKELRLKEGEELLFFFDRKTSRKDKQFIVGFDKNQNRIALCYAYLWNYDKYNKPFSWEQGNAYLIKSNGIYKKRKKDIGYYTFSVKEIEK